MWEYINTPFGAVRSYTFFINLGAVISSIICIWLNFRKSKSWKHALAVSVMSLTLVAAGFFTGRVLRGISYGEIRTAGDFFHLFTEAQGNHFIGRVILPYGYIRQYFPQFFGRRKVNGWIIWTYSVYV